MRTRTIDRTEGPSYVLKAMFDNAGHGSASCSNFFTAYVGRISTMHDTNNSSSWDRNAVTMSACELFRKERIAEDNPIRTAEAANINGSLAKVTFSGDFAGYFAFGLPNRLEVDMDNAAGIALIDAYAKMNSSTTLSGEQIATMSQTIGMIRSPFKSLTKLATQARKRLKARKASIYRTYKRDRARLRRIKAKPISFQELAKALLLDLEKAAADCWLELRYGMQPLLIDAENHIDYIKLKLQQQSVHGERRVARSSKLSKTANDSYSGPTECGLDYVYGPHVSASWSLEKHVTAGVVYKVYPRSNAEELSAHMGTRLRDIPVTLWALIPLSFVVDWAVNVEAWLQAIVPSPGTQPLANWVTTLEKRETAVSGIKFYTYLGWFTNHKVDFTFPPGSEKTFQYTREVDNSLSSHPLILGKPLSTARVGDASAMGVAKFVTAIKGLFR